MQWQNRQHFLSMAARQMRRVLVDIARAKGFQKRGGDAVHVTFDHDLPAVKEPGRSGGARRRARSAGARGRAQGARGGDALLRRLSVEESARALDVSVDTVMRDWKMAKAWLLRELRRPAEGSPA